MKIADKIYSQLETLKIEISKNYDIDYEDINQSFCETETKIHYFFEEFEKNNEYIRIGNTPIHIIVSDKNPNEYMVMAYDLKNYTWRNADIYAQTPKDCIDIANIVFGDSNITMPDNELDIKIDYGNDDLIY